MNLFFESRQLADDLIDKKSKKYSDVCFRYNENKIVES